MADFAVGGRYDRAVRRGGGALGVAKKCADDSSRRDYRDAGRPVSEDQSAAHKRDYAEPGDTRDYPKALGRNADNRGQPRCRRTGRRHSRGAGFAQAAQNAASVTRAIDELVGSEPGHEGTQLAPDLFDRMLLGFLAQSFEVLHPGVILADPFVGELARLDIGENLLHRIARRLADDAFAARHIAVLGGV